VATAAVAEKMSGSAFSQFSQPAGKGMGFYTGEDGYMYCDNMRVDDIRHQVRGGSVSHAHAVTCLHAVTCCQYHGTLTLCCMYQQQVQAPVTCTLCT
jgi:hypothetical protein